MDVKEFTGICKSVISADTIVVTQSPDDIERIVHLEGLSAPRLGARDRLDEPHAFSSREYLRPLLVGKEVRVSMKGTASNGTVEYGSVFALAPAGEVDVSFQIIKAGWAKLREHVLVSPEYTAEEKWQRYAAVEKEAKRALRGVWAPAPPLVVRHSPPADKVAFLNEHKNKRLTAIIEQVFNGSTLRVRLIISPEEHQYVLFMIAGVRAPRATGPKGEVPEDLGDEAKLFIEQRLLQRRVYLTLLSLSTPPSGPGLNSNSDIPTLFIGNIEHPAGNIAAFLLAQGLARVVDWHAGFISLFDPNLMGQLRSIEQGAKTAHKGVWKTAEAAAPAPTSPAFTSGEYVVTRVWSADSVSIMPRPVGSGAAAATESNGVGASAESNGASSGDAVDPTAALGSSLASLHLGTAPAPETRVYLSSVRQIKPGNAQIVELLNESREFLRKKLIGKTVHVQLDYERPAEAQFEARLCVTLRLKRTNIATLLIERGYLTVLRHRQGDVQKSSDYDALMAAELVAVEQARGIHGLSATPGPAPKPSVDASATVVRANSHLATLRRAGRIPAIVEFAAGATRFKLLLPRQGDLRLTLVLAGVRAPRAARSATERSEPLAAEAAAFAYRRFMQRDVTVTIEAVDRAGAFIGRMALAGAPGGGSADAGELLLSAGLARLDDYAEPSPAYAAAFAAAKAAGAGIHGLPERARPTAGPATPTAPASSDRPVKAQTEYIDILISDIRPSAVAATPLTFSVQVLRNGGIPELETLMSQLATHARTAATHTPHPNEHVLARFSVDRQWYRARVRRTNAAKRIVQVTYIDYGNTETVSWDDVRALPAKFLTLPPQARDARLSFISLLDEERVGADYAHEALARLRELCEGHNLVANIDHSDSQTLYLSLFVPDILESSAHEESVNVLLVREGLALVDRQSILRDAYPQVVKALDEASAQAKRDRVGVYEHGDFLE